MATFKKFNDFTEQLIRGVHDWDAHSFKLALSNTAPAGTDPNWTDTQLSTITQIGTGTGYATGGTAITTVGITEALGVTTITGTEVVFTATGTMGPFRYVILYNDTSASDSLIAFWDYGTNITLNTGETFTVKFNGASTGTIFTLT